MFLRCAAFCALMVSFGACLQALDMPQRPLHRVNDYAGILSSTDTAGLEQSLQAFEQQTSNQLVIALFPSLENEDLNDFTNRLFEKWHLGQKDRNNGVLLAVFLKEHKVRIEVGYGLEPVLTDAISSDIIRNTIAPAFREERYADGLRAAVDQIERATRGEYKGSGAQQRPQSYAPFILFILFMIVFIWISHRRRNDGIFLPGSGQGRGGFPWIFFPPGPMNRRGGDDDGWNSGGGGGISGGGGFSGGGGLSGGGGASGSW